MTDAEATPPWVTAFGAHIASWPRRWRRVLSVTTTYRPFIRHYFAARYLRGHGVEIGAQCVPTLVDPKRATVEYVDAVSNKYLVDRYRLEAKALVPLTHVIEGENLHVYADGSRDFLIAHHVLEHIDDPVGALVEWLRVLRPGGILYVTLPNYSTNPYDFRRRPTNRAHLKLDRDDAEGRASRNFLHYCDMARSLWQYAADDSQIASTASEWLAAGDRHHYHVWDAVALRDAFDLAAESAGSLIVRNFLLLPTSFELLVVIEKGGTGGLSGWPRNPQPGSLANLGVILGLGALRRATGRRLGARFRHVIGRGSEGPARDRPES